MINQTFPVYYQDEIYMVDPTLLYNSSKRFRELLNEKREKNDDLRLRIAYDKFSGRNVNNFLKLCQNQQTDVQNFEIEEICLIAKMFQADEIYNTGIIFIQNNINPNFFIPYNQFDETKGIRYLILESESEASSLIHHANLNELEFDDSNENFATKPKEISEKKNDIDNNLKYSMVKPVKHISVIYSIIEDNHLVKCTRFYLKKGDQVLYMAKIKNEEIYIGGGSNFHISENKIENTARIVRNHADYNIITTDNQEFKIKFVKYGDKYTLSVSFVHKGSKLNWKPTIVKNTNLYNGELNHTTIPSKKNLILLNSRNHPTFIVRKISKKSYETECHPNVNPLIAFSIAISQITGPI